MSRDLNLLTVNSGSSSLKMARYRVSQMETRRMAECLIDQKGTPDHGAALRKGLASIEGQTSSPDIDGIGHRVVVGDRRCLEPQLIGELLVKTLRELCDFDPDHMPQVIDAIETLADLYPGVPQVACFDSAFHSRMPRTSQIYALPRRYFEEGVSRYGFHGLSCEFIMQELSALDPTVSDGRVIIAHLGNGASVTAVEHGVSIDTSMGLTPIAGLVMGTRCGDVDPGVLLYLMNRHGMTFSRLNDLLNKESGLLGLSEYSADMRDLLERETTETRCAEAIAIFCYNVRKFIGAYTAALTRLDTLIFTGGIGEHAAVVRERICAGLNCIGITLDVEANTVNEAVISAKGSPVTVRVIRTNEDLMIAQHTSRVITQ